MFEIDFELSRFAKTTLSWMVTAELLKLVDGKRAVVTTYPFDGHYDCLTISSYDHKNQILLNRLGSSALAENELVENIWARACYSPRETALHIMSESQINARLETGDNGQMVLGATRIAKFLSEDMHETAEVEWAWNEFSPEESEQHLIESIAVPQAWKVSESPVDGTSWVAWVWLLRNPSGIQAAVNLKTGEIITPKGSPYRSPWSNKPIVDLDDDPTTAIAYELRITDDSNHSTTSQFVRPSLARGMARIAEEEGDNATLIPVTSLATLDDVKGVWTSMGRLSDYLD